MIMRLLILFLLFSTIAIAEEPAVVQEETTVKKFVCKTIPQAGSRIPRKVCLSQEKWEEAEKIAEEALEKGQNSSLMINKEGG